MAAGRGRSSLNIHHFLRLAQLLSRHRLVAGRRRSQQRSGKLPWSARPAGRRTALNKSCKETPCLLTSGSHVVRSSAPLQHQLPGATEIGHGGLKRRPVDPTGHRRPHG
jgi:hypothetical protein